MILIRLMASFTEVGFRYKLFFTIEPLLLFQVGVGSKTRENVTKH